LVADLGGCAIRSIGSGVKGHEGGRVKGVGEANALDLDDI